MKFAIQFCFEELQKLSKKLWVMLFNLSVVLLQSCLTLQSASGKHAKWDLEDSVRSLKQ